MPAADALPSVKAVRSSSRTYTDPALRTIRVLDEVPARQLSDRFACSLGQVYVTALRKGVWPLRYVRNRDIISCEEQLQLADSRVAVIGCGGLGGTVVLLLARIGIGLLSVADGDIFDETNLNRQALSDTSNVGAAKAEEAAKAVYRVNPAVAVRVYRQTVDATNVDAVLADAQVVVDALDNIADRLTLGAAARRLGLPLVHGALAGFDGQVMTIFPEDSGLEKVYGDRPPPRSETARPEAILGVPTPTPSIVATIQVMEVLKILLDRGQLVRNRLLHIDLENGRFDSFGF
jgi:molybdopterin/thiamine biosynthesis adenylyltransferase